MSLTKVATTLRLVASILEAAIEDDLKAEYPDLVDAIDKLVAEDPSGGRRKYLRWQVEQVKKKEPLNEVISLVKTFHKTQPRLEKKDLYSYKTLGELRGAIEGLAPKKSRSEKKGNHEYLLNTEDVLVVHPKDMEASCFFGKGAQWCISAEMSENYFDNYAERNNYFYFVIDKRAEPRTAWSKLAIQMVRGNNNPTYWDATDEEVTYYEVMTRFGVPMELWWQAILDRHRKQEDTIQHAIATGNIMRVQEAVGGSLTEELAVALRERYESFPYASQMATFIGNAKYGLPFTVAIDYNTYNEGTFAAFAKVTTETVIVDGYQIVPALTGVFWIDGGIQYDRERNGGASFLIHLLDLDDYLEIDLKKTIVEHFPKPVDDGRYAYNDERWASKEDAMIHALYNNDDTGKVGFIEDMPLFIRQRDDWEVLSSQFSFKRYRTVAEILFSDGQIPPVTNDQVEELLEFDDEGWQLVGKELLKLLQEN